MCLLHPQEGAEDGQRLEIPLVIFPSLAVSDDYHGGILVCRSSYRIAVAIHPDAAFFGQRHF